MVAEFRGAPPHDLGTAELAMARGVDKDIEVTLHLLDDWHRPTDQIVRVRMAPSYGAHACGSAMGRRGNDGHPIARLA